MAYISGLPREIRDELDKYYIRSRYQDLPKDLRKLIKPYIARYYISFVAALDPSPGFRVYRIQLGDYVIEGKATIDELQKFTRGFYALIQPSMDDQRTALSAGWDSLKYISVTPTIALINEFPRYVGEILIDKIKEYLDEVRRL